MWDFSPDPGRLLREFRLRRKLTLRAAAHLLHTSAPVLSRKERSIVSIDRLDVQSAIEGYKLDAWESFILWTATGLLPSPTSPAINSDHLRDKAEAVIASVAEPALLADEYLYIQAWNSGIELLWQLSRRDGSIHLIDILFSDPMRQQTGAQWQSLCLRTLRLFRQMTRPHAQEARMHRLLARFESQYGQEFVEKWNMAVGATDGTGEAYEPLILQLDSPVGPVDFLLAQAAYTTYTPWLLCIYLPYGESCRARYDRLIGDRRDERIYRGSALHADGDGTPEPA